MKTSKSIGFPSSAWVWWAAKAAALALLLGVIPDVLPGGSPWLKAANAERRRVVVLEFEGPSADKFAADIGKVVRQGHTLVALAKWMEAAEKADALKISSANIKRVAKKLNVDGVISGNVEKRRDRYILRLKLREGRSGDVVGRGIEITSSEPRLDKTAIKDAKEELLDAIGTLKTVSGGSDDGGEAEIEDADDKERRIRREREEAAERKEEDREEKRITEQDRRRSAKEEKAEKARLAKEEREEKARLAKEEREEKARLRREEREEKARLAKEEREEKAGSRRRADEERDREDDDPLRTPSRDRDSDVEASRDREDEDAEDDRENERRRKRIADAESPDGDSDRDDRDDRDRDRDREADEDKPEAKDDDETPTKIVERSKKPQLSPGERGVDLVVGVSALARRLKFSYLSDLEDAPANLQTLPSFGAAVDGTIYPLALGDGDSFLRHLGVTFGFDRSFGYSINLEVQEGEGKTTTPLPTVRQRYDVGLAVRFPLGSSATAPVIGLRARYGRLKFNIDKGAAPDGATVDVPNVHYMMFEPGLFAAIPIVKRFTIGASAAFLAMRKAGAITSPEEYGGAAITAIDSELYFDIGVTSALFARLSGKFTTIGFAFRGNGMKSYGRDTDVMQDVFGARDSYFGGNVSMGYVF